MRTNFVLVDFENVQPEDLALLKDGPFKVKMFLGPHQSKIPVAHAAALQSLGSIAEYVILEAAGRNALDFHIAYYIGVLSSQEPIAFFHIISKDSGFDPLIKHLKARKVFAQRSPCIADIPYFKPQLPTTPEAQIEVVVADPNPSEVGATSNSEDFAQHSARAISKGAFGRPARAAVFFLVQARRGQD